MFISHSSVCVWMSFPPVNNAGARRLLQYSWLFLRRGFSPAAYRSGEILPSAIFLAAKFLNAVRRAGNWAAARFNTPLTPALNLHEHTLSPSPRQPLYCGELDLMLQVEVPLESQCECVLINTHTCTRVCRDGVPGPGAGVTAGVSCRGEKVNLGERERRIKCV